MNDPSGLRVSDQERDEAAADLRDHYAAGRLSSDELSDRLDAVYAAQTAPELARLRADLPDLRPVRRADDPRRTLARRRIYQDAGGVVIANVGCVGVWAASGAHGAFWPAWVMLVSALRLGRDGWRLFGPGGALESGASDEELRGDGRRGGREGRHERHVAQREERAARKAALNEQALTHYYEERRRRRH
jgi:uncharacterized protein DUF1707